MFLVTKVAHFIVKQSLISKNQKIVVGFSGGPDSVFLAHILLFLQKTNDLSIHLAHLDHGWRPSSVKDVEFCSQFAKKHDLPISLGLGQSFAPELKFNGSKEEFARNMRKAFFKKVMLETKADLLALAHHADDQLETFFIRIMRGATISGLKSMVTKQGSIIRPLLNTSKTDILNFLHEQAIPYCTDETNNSDLFLRNRIRNHIIPACDQADTRFKHNGLRTINNLAETEAYLVSHTHELFNTLSFLSEHKKLSLDIKKLLTIDFFMQRRLIMHWLCTEKVSFNPSENIILEILRFLRESKASTHTVHTWAIHKKNSIATIVHLN